MRQEGQNRQTAWSEKIRSLEWAHPVSDRNVCQRKSKANSLTGKWKRLTQILQLIPNSLVLLFEQKETVPTAFECEFKLIILLHELII